MMDIGVGPASAAKTVALLNIDNRLQQRFGLRVAPLGSSMPRWSWAFR